MRVFEEMQGEDANHNPDELFLLRLRFKEGRLLEAGNNQPLLLEDPEILWVVYSGGVNVFAVPTVRGEAAGVRRYICTVRPGQAVFGAGRGDAPDHPALLAVALEGTRLIRIPRQRLTDLARQPDFERPAAALVEQWTAALLTGFRRGGAPPQGALLLPPGEEARLPAGGCVRAEQGVVWACPLAGRLHPFGRTTLPPLPADRFFPISGMAWLGAEDAAHLRTEQTTTLQQQGRLWANLDTFHRTALACAAAVAAEAEIADRDLLRRRAETDRAAAAAGLRDLASVLARPGLEAATETPLADPLLAACRIVGAAQGISFRAPKQASNAPDPLGEIARASRVRLRRVTLCGDWWRAESGPLLTYKRGDRCPVALIPTRRGGYEIVDVVAGTRGRLTEESAADLAAEAYAFYCPFPDGPIPVRRLLRFGLTGSRRDLLLIGAMGVAGGLLALLAPLFTARIIDTVLPDADPARLPRICLGLAVAAMAAALFQVTRAVAVLRLETRAEATVEAALWDRLLRLPPSFFRQYTAGDLAERAMGIGAIRQLASGAAADTLLGAVFSVFSFALLFAIDLRLALVAVLTIVPALAAALLSGSVQVRCQRRMTEAQGRLSGVVLQMLTAIAKLRVAGAEQRAFRIWADAFAGQRRLRFRIGTAGNLRDTFNAAWPLLTTAAVFAAVTYGSRGPMSAGTFLAFSAAFGQFGAATLALADTLTSLLQIVPLYERARPILETPPEDNEERTDPGELTGAVEVSQVSFRYAPGGPLALRELSLRAEPGEFIAIVGPSGAGKSSLLRVLLGFEQPETGSVYVDGQDLRHLDREAVRRQLGVVMQNGKLIPGSILDNIIGSSLMTLEEAWEAARLAGIEQDIKRLPMGMFTYIGDGGTTFSGGQRQRLMIARAIASRPRILLFDEATSALDNRAQALVSESLRRLQATRIVIAHRLSTIRDADRIYVLENGQVVQCGTYQELVEQPGLFALLAKRQIA